MAVQYAGALPSSPRLMLVALTWVFASLARGWGQSASLPSMLSYLEGLFFRSGHQRRWAWPSHPASLLIANLFVLSIDWGGTSYTLHQYF